MSDPRPHRLRRYARRTALALALLPVAAFALLVHRRVQSLWLLLPVAAVAWALVHASGVHGTVAGVLLAFTVPVRRRERSVRCA